MNPVAIVLLAFMGGFIAAVGTWFLWDLAANVRVVRANMALRRQLRREAKQRALEEASGADLGIGGGRED